MAPPFIGRLSSLIYFRTKAAAPWCHLICFFARLLEAPLLPPSPDGCNGPSIPAAPTCLIGFQLGLGRVLPLGRHTVFPSCNRSLGCPDTSVLCFRNALRCEICGHCSTGKSALSRRNTAKKQRRTKYSRNTIRPLDFGKNRQYNVRNKAREPCWYGSLALFIL